MFSLFFLKMKAFFTVLAFVVLSFGCMHMGTMWKVGDHRLVSQMPPRNEPNTTATTPEYVAVRREIVQAFTHTWDNYKKYAWGRDEIDSVTSKGKDNWGGVAVTLVDALDTAIVMNLTGRVEDAIRFLASSFSFVKDHNMNTFEMTIRVLGGFIASYDLTHDPRLLRLANHVARALLPAFQNDTVFPEVNPLKGVPLRGYTTLAAQGSVQFEYARLGMITGNQAYRNAAATWNLYIHRAVTPMSLNGGHDSLHEYVLKMAILLQDDVLKTKYNEMVRTIKRRRLRRQGDRVFVTDQIGFTEHLACFFSGTLALGILTNISNAPKSDLDLADKLVTTCYALYHDNKATGLAPDAFFVRKKGVVVQDYKFDLRPETVESIFYMYKLTRDTKYLAWARNIFDSLQKHCKSKYGYSGLRDVRNSHQTGQQPSFWMAEVLKYLYLLFTDSAILDEYVLSTEAHPFRVSTRPFQTLSFT